jgi:hypothetical protein
MRRRWLTGLLGLPLCVAAGEPPPRLRDTGLEAPGVMAFAPQFALWSDGAAKRRWLQLPPGRAIDARQPDAWNFPPGTRLWKEFALAGRPVETRFIERGADGAWGYASYVWNAAGTDATLAPAAGLALTVDGRRYEVPARTDCTACHEAAPVPVLGYSAVQLAPQLRALVERGVLQGLPAALLAGPLQIPAASDLERRALGYLHANCGHCHHEHGVPVRLNLQQRVADAEAAAAAVLRSVLHAPSRWRLPGAPDLPVIAPGDPQRSVLALRMKSRDPRRQMPPLGTHEPDAEGSALVDAWITHPPSPSKENPP